MSAHPRSQLRACECGWSGVYTTAGYADKALRSHSCDVDWRPRECAHRTRHEHGTYACYNHCGCHCWPCRLAMLEQIAGAERRRAYGRGRLVDATAARQHLIALRAAGMGRPRISELSGIEHSVLTRILIGKHRNGRREFSTRITRGTEAAILLVSPDPADGGAPVDIGPTRRRLQALIALGWYPSLLGRQLGLNQAYLERLLTRMDRVRPGTARRIHAQYLDIAQRPAPTGVYADRARRQARERGWPLPIRLGGRVLAGTALEAVA